MRARIWGCRGSLATPGRETVRYGGNTSCLEVVLDDGTILVLDAGTGARALGLELEADGAPVHLLLTHLHLDHLEGLGFFTPIWNPENVVHIWGPASPVRSLADRIAAYLSPPLFPVQLADIPAQLVFHDVPDEPWQIGGARVTADQVAHPGPTVGYRIEADGAVLAYIPDHEPTLGTDISELTLDWVSGGGVAEDADVLLHDSQYFEDEYDQRVGWGHSSVAQTVAFARLARARQLILFHHDPHHTDRDLVELQARARELWDGGDEPPELAREGETIEIARPAAAA